MSESLRLLGIDPEEFSWKDLALCDGQDTNLYFDDYESDEQVARTIDEGCLSCPVMVQCLQAGMDNSEWGVWGSIYLSNGRVDQNRNAHKEAAVWNEIKERLGGQPV